MQILAKKYTEWAMADCLYRDFSDGRHACRVAGDNADTIVPKPGHFMRHERLTLPCTRLRGAGVAAACPRRVLGSSANLQQCPPRVRVMPFLLVGGCREIVLSAPIFPTGSIRLGQRVTGPAELTLVPLRVDTLGDRLIGDIAPREPA